MTFADPFTQVTLVHINMHQAATATLQTFNASTSSLISCALCCWAQSSAMCRWRTVFCRVDSWEVLPCQQYTYKHFVFSKMLKLETRKDDLFTSCLCDAAQILCADEGYRWKAELKTESALKSPSFFRSCSFCRSHTMSGHDGVH